jgi:hypothetical protein
VRWAERESTRIPAAGCYRSGNNASGQKIGGFSPSVLGIACLHIAPGHDLSVKRPNDHLTDGGPPWLANRTRRCWAAIRRSALFDSPLRPPKPTYLEQFAEHSFGNENERQCDCKDRDSMNVRKPTDDPGGEDYHNCPAESPESDYLCFGFHSPRTELG